MKLVSISRKEFESKKDLSYSDKSYEYYCVFPILNRESRKKLTLFARNNKDGLDIMKEACKLLEEERKNK